jgi:hypothetical protein
VPNRIVGEVMERRPPRLDVACSECAREVAKVFAKRIPQGIGVDRDEGSRTTASRNACDIAESNRAVGLLYDDPVRAAAVPPTDLRGTVHVSIAFHAPAVADCNPGIDPQKSLDDRVMICVSHLNSLQN